MDTKGYMEKTKSTGKKIFSPAHLKAVAAVAVVCAMIGGGASAYIHQQKETQHAQAIAAQTDMIEAQARQKGLALISDDQVADITAATIGVDGDKIQYNRVNLTLQGDKNKEKKHEDSDKHEKNKKHKPDSNTKQLMKEAPAVQDAAAQAQATDADSGATAKTATAANEFTPIYNVSCQANNVKYQLKIDAVTGTVLSSKVKNA